MLACSPSFLRLGPNMLLVSDTQQQNVASLGGLRAAQFQD